MASLIPIFSEENVRRVIASGLYRVDWLQENVIRQKAGFKILKENSQKCHC